MSQGCTRPGELPSDSRTSSARRSSRITHPTSLWVHLPTRASCEKQTKSFPDAKFEKFSTQAEAEAFAFPSGHPSATPSTASSSKRPRQPSPPPPTLSVKKPKGRSPTIHNHTAASVEPSTYDEATGLWKTESGRIVVYTDGSALGNGRQGAVAGLGVWWAKDSPRSVGNPSRERPHRRWLGFTDACFHLPFPGIERKGCRVRCRPTTEESFW